jgi:hypothetical protein
VEGQVRHRGALRSLRLRGHPMSTLLIVVLVVLLLGGGGFYWSRRG